ncbi:MAG: hypothetical protein RKH07_01530 [Gammaproteobacteria bacterium]
MNQNIILRMGIIPSTILFSAIAVLVSVILAIFLFNMFGIEIIFRNIILAFIVPSLVAPPIIYYYGKLLLEIAKTEEVLRARTDELQAALADVKQLSGMLPICAHCKDIRDDEGYWNEIESYVGRRSEATFSHGICPDCAKRYYPNVKLPSSSST